MSEHNDEGRFLCGGSDEESLVDARDKGETDAAVDIGVRQFVEELKEYAEGRILCLSRRSSSLTCVKAIFFTL